MKRVFLISDTHWNHKSIVSAGHRPPDHGERTLAALRRTLRPDDTLIHLGDVIFASAPKLLDLLSGLPGHKVLVRGNHDNQSHNWYVAQGFDACMDGLILKRAGRRILFTHEPEDPGPFDLNIHGHLHKPDGHRALDYADKPWFLPGITHLLFTLEDLYSPVELDSFIHKHLNQ